MKDIGYALVVLAVTLLVSTVNAQVVIPKQAKQLLASTEQDFLAGVRNSNALEEVTIREDRLKR